MTRLAGTVCALALLSVTAAIDAREVSATVTSTTANCRDPSAQEHRICVQHGERIGGQPRVDITSRIGPGTDVTAQYPDPQDPSCYVIKTRVVPVGEDCVRFPWGGAPVCNCKGHGSIDVKVNLEAVPR